MLLQKHSGIKLLLLLIILIITYSLLDLSLIQGWTRESYAFKSLVIG